MPLYKKLISQISCGDFHTLALERDSRMIWAWGSLSQKNAGQFNRGQCGLNSNDLGKP